MYPRPREPETAAPTAAETPAETQAPAETTSAEAPPQTEAAQGGRLSGDVNGDGTANLADTVLLQKYLLGETALTAAQAKAADLQADDSINGFDLAVLRQLLTKVA